MILAGQILTDWIVTSKISTDEIEEELVDARVVA